MTIEIHHPEIESLIRQQLESGAFATVEDVLFDALKASASKSQPVLPASPRSLVEVCAMVQGLLTDEEIDTVFRRDFSPDRPVHIS